MAIVALACAGACTVLRLSAGAQGAAPAPSKRIVLDHSIGGVVLRESRSAVERDMGRGLVLSSRMDDSARPEPVRVDRVSYLSGALIVTYVSSTKQRSVAIVLESRSPRFRTQSGIGVGSTFAALRSIGRVKCNGPSFTECQHGYLTLNKPGTTFRLDRPRGKIAYVAMAFGH